MYQDAEWYYEYGYIDMEPLEYVFLYYGEYCVAYEPDYEPYNQCIEQIDYDQFNSDLNTKLEEFIRNKGVSEDYVYVPFANNASIYCDTVFEDAILAEGKILCYE